MVKKVEPLQFLGALKLLLYRRLLLLPHLSWATVATLLCVNIYHLQKCLSIITIFCNTELDTHKDEAILLPSQGQAVV